MKKRASVHATMRRLRYRDGQCFTFIRMNFNLLLLFSFLEYFFVLFSIHFFLPCRFKSLWLANYIEDIKQTARKVRSGSTISAMKNHIFMSHSSNGFHSHVLWIEWQARVQMLNIFHISSNFLQLFAVFLGCTFQTHQHSLFGAWTFSFCWIFCSFFFLSSHSNYANIVMRMQLQFKPIITATASVIEARCCTYD